LTVASDEHARMRRRSLILGHHGFGAASLVTVALVGMILASNVASSTTRVISRGSTRVCRWGVVKMSRKAR
jgi:hypothetical protein